MIYWTSLQYPATTHLSAGLLFITYPQNRNTFISPKTLHFKLTKWVLLLWCFTETRSCVLWLCPSGRKGRSRHKRNRAGVRHLLKLRSRSPSPPPPQVIKPWPSVPYSVTQLCLFLKYAPISSFWTCSVSTLVLLHFFSSTACSTVKVPVITRRLNLSAFPDQWSFTKTRICVSVRDYFVVIYSAVCVCSLSWGITSLSTLFMSTPSILLIAKSR